jgi:hypothetical protein
MIIVKVKSDDVEAGIRPPVLVSGYILDRITGSNRIFLFL